MYLSFYSSFLFYILSMVSYKYYPNDFRLFPIIFFILSTVSVLHHTRRYDEEYFDEVGILDYSIALTTGIILIYYYYNKLILWIMLSSICYIKYYLYKTEEANTKSKLHFWMHIISFICILCLLLDIQILNT